MSLVYICLWLLVGIISGAALWDIYCQWKKALNRELEAERKRNEVLRDYLHALERNLDVVREQRDEALEAYEKISHSWPFSISEEEQERNIVIKKGELQGIVREIFRAGLEEKKRMEDMKNE